MLSVENKWLDGISYIDLFAGIGGFHLALSSYGASCVFASEWDKHAAQTYQDNFGLKPQGDITLVDEKDIPNHDILCGGFPCQAFSISGKQKGFEDTRGTLFFDIARIAKYHKPKVLFLENVKNLAKHDDGRTLTTILNTLENLGYRVFMKVLNTSHYGLPQNRERIFIIGFHHSINAASFQFPKPIEQKVRLFDFLEKSPIDTKIIDRNDIEINKTYTSSKNLFEDETLLNKPIQIGKVNKGGQGERIYHTDGHAITLSAYGGGVGAKTGLYLVNGEVRRLSTRECARIQGFPEEFIINPINTQAYKQFGNSVSVNVLQYILAEIISVLRLNNLIKEKENSQSQYA